MVKLHRALIYSKRTEVSGIYLYLSQTYICPSRPGTFKIFQCQCSKIFFNCVISRVPIIFGKYVMVWPIVVLRLYYSYSQSWSCVLHYCLHRAYFTFVVVQCSRYEPYSL